MKIVKNYDLPLIPAFKSAMEEKIHTEVVAIFSNWLKSDEDITTVAGCSMLRSTIKSQLTNHLQNPGSLTSLYVMRDIAQKIRPEFEELWFCTVALDIIDQLMEQLSIEIKAGVESYFIDPSDTYYPQDIEQNMDPHQDSTATGARQMQFHEPLFKVRVTNSQTVVKQLIDPHPQEEGYHFHGYKFTAKQIGQVLDSNQLGQVYIPWQTIFPTITHEEKEAMRAFIKALISDKWVKLALIAKFPELENKIDQFVFRWNKANLEFRAFKEFQKTKLHLQPQEQLSKQAVPHDAVEPKYKFDTKEYSLADIRKILNVNNRNYPKPVNAAEMFKPLTTKRERKLAKAIASNPPNSTQNIKDEINKKFPDCPSLTKEIDDFIRRCYANWTVKTIRALPNPYYVFRYKGHSFIHQDIQSLLNSQPNENGNYNFTHSPKSSFLLKGLQTNDENICENIVTYGFATRQELDDLLQRFSNSQKTTTKLLPTLTQQMILKPVNSYTTQLIITTSLPDDKKMLIESMPPSKQSSKENTASKLEIQEKEMKIE
jgi:hypothetical protein